MLEKLVQKLLPFTLIINTLNAETKMQVEGPFITTEGIEKKWDYYISNSSTAHDANNMIELKINAGKNKQPPFPRPPVRPPALSTAFTGKAIS
jgi:hypothetical protein